MCKVHWMDRWRAAGPQPTHRTPYALALALDLMLSKSGGGVLGARHCYARTNLVIRGRGERHGPWSQHQRLILLLILDKNALKLNLLCVGVYTLYIKVDSWMKTII